MTEGTAGQRAASGSTASTWSVRGLSEAIADHLRDAFPSEVWVRGEIRDLSRARSGHVYFTLTDTGDDEGLATAHLNVMLSANAKTRVNRLLMRAGGRVRMTDGTEVRIRGRLDYYAGRGQLQLRMTSIDPAFTLGQLAAARAELIERLTTEGLLRANAACPIPLAPLRIGLVTAAGSAAEADVLHELEGSGFRFEVLAADVRVQGDDAPAEVAAAIAGLARRGPDLILVARGGGAASDLSAFDSELVARTIATCAIAVITGIGHETDRSVADEVAHTAAKTPTAAAQHVVALVSNALARAEATWEAIAGRSRTLLERAEHHLDRARIRAVAGTTTATARADDQLVARAARARRAAVQALAAAETRLDAFASRRDALDPARALARGWSITHTADGQLVRSPHDISPGTRLVTTVATGTLVSAVIDDAEDQ